MNTCAILSTLRSSHLFRILQWWQCGGIEIYVLCSSCHQNRKLGNFTMLFYKRPNGIVLKCVPHVQNAYFSLFHQSNSEFVALLLPIPSSMPKLPISHEEPTITHAQRNQKRKLLFVFVLVLRSKPFLCKKPGVKNLINLVINLSLWGLIIGEIFAIRDSQIFGGQS